MIYGLRLVYLVHEYSFIPAPFVETNTVISPLNCLCTFAENELIIYVKSIFRYSICYIDLYSQHFNRVNITEKQRERKENNRGTKDREGSEELIIRAIIFS